ncbi:MAG: Gfo/Idh/MocA family oxidoreductase [Armatimonadota bacterium]
MVNVALIGAGGHSLGCHAPALQSFAARHPEWVRLAAVCDLDDEKARKAAVAFGFARAYASIERMMGEERPDAVVSVTPIAATRAVTRELLPYGVPLLIEKPLGNSIAEAREIAAMVGGAPVMVSMNRRFDPGINRALAWAREQGPIRFARATQLRPGRDEADFVWGTGIHVIDALNYLAGPLRVAHAAAMPQAPGGCWRAATLEGPGAVVHLEILPTVGRIEEQFRLAGDEYCVDVWTHFAHPWRVEGYRNSELVLEEQASPETPGCVNNGTCGETEAFLTAVYEGRPLPGPGVRDALQSSELAAELQDR